MDFVLHGFISAWASGAENLTWKIASWRLPFPFGPNSLHKLQRIIQQQAVTWPEFNSRTFQFVPLSAVKLGQEHPDKHPSVQAWPDVAFPEAYGGSLRNNLGRAQEHCINYYLSLWDEKTPSHVGTYQWRMLRAFSAPFLFLSKVSMASNSTIRKAEAMLANILKILIASDLQQAQRSWRPGTQHNRKLSSANTALGGDALHQLGKLQSYLNSHLTLSSWCVTQWCGNTPCQPQLIASLISYVSWLVTYLRAAWPSFDGIQRQDLTRMSLCMWLCCYHRQECFDLVLSRLSLVWAGRRLCTAASQCHQAGRWYPPTAQGTLEPLKKNTGVHLLMYRRGCSPHNCEKCIIGPIMGAFGRRVIGKG